MSAPGFGAGLVDMPTLPPITRGGTLGSESAFTRLLGGLWIGVKWTAFGAALMVHPQPERSQATTKIAITSLNFSVSKVRGGVIEFRGRFMKLYRRHRYFRNAGSRRLIRQAETRQGYASAAASYASTRATNAALAASGIRGTPYAMDGVRRRRCRCRVLSHRAKNPPPTFPEARSAAIIGAKFEESSEECRVWYHGIREPVGVLYSVPRISSRSSV